MSTLPACARLEIRAAPHRAFLLTAVGHDRSETILDAGLTRAKAREEGCRLAQRLKVPLVDCTVTGVAGWRGNGRTQIRAGGA